MNESVPALSLPTEIACTVFKMVSSSIPPIYPVGLPKDTRYMRMEINVSQVCRLWRSMALTYPELWSTFAHDDRWNCRIPVDCLSTYLQRSRNRPLDLYFKLGTRKRDDWVATMELLVAHVPRWRRLSLRIDRSWPLEFFLNEIKRLSAPNLEIFEIVGPGGLSPFTTWKRQSQCFREAPKLTSIRHHPNERAKKQ